MNENCDCAAAGSCHRYRRVMADRHWQICQGTVLTPEKCAVYRANWAKLALESQANEDRGRILRQGPGTELKKLFAELGVTSFAGCDCDAKAAQMNRWGVEGCRANFTAIRGWVSEAQAKADWSVKIAAATRAATSGLALRLDPLDIAGSLVRLAIERAASGQSESSLPSKN